MGRADAALITADLLAIQTASLTPRSDNHFRLAAATGNDSEGYVYAFGYNLSLKKNNTQSYDDLVARAHSVYGSAGIEIYGGVFTVGEKNDSGISGTIDFGYKTDTYNISIHQPQRYEVGDRLTMVTSINNINPSGVEDEMKFMKFFRDNFSVELPKVVYGTGPVDYPEDWVK